MVETNTTKKIMIPINQITASRFTDLTLFPLCKKIAPSMKFKASTVTASMYTICLNQGNTACQNTQEGIRIQIVSSYCRIAEETTLPEDDMFMPNFSIP
jgi:hypothetical protein